MQTFCSFLAKWLNLFISKDIINKSWIMRSVGHVIKSCESQRAFQYIISIVIQVLSLWSMCLSFWNKIISICTGGFFFKKIYSLITEKKICQDIFTVTLGNMSVYLPKQYCYQINMSLFIKCDLVKHIYAETEVGI